MFINVFGKIEFNFPFNRYLYFGSHVPNQLSLWEFEEDGHIFANYCQTISSIFTGHGQSISRKENYR